MAPVAPSKRPSLRAKAAAARKPAAGSGSQAPAATASSSAAADALSSHTKRDRRATKHASFVSRIEKSRAAGSSSKALKRRRPGNKLVANLDSLADALPDVAAAAAAAQAGQGSSSGKVKHRSLRSRPGALKRKEKVVRGEVQRFGASLARLNALGEQARSATAEQPQQQQQQQQQQQTPAEAQKTASGSANNTGAAASSSASTPNRWAALRGFISATMEQNPAFVEK